MLNASTSTLMWRSASETLSEQDVMNTHENEQNFYKRLQCRAVALGAVTSTIVKQHIQKATFSELLRRISGKT